ncbi:hypothetical protein [Haloarcula halophila]|uniref:hypothetical protein n=1 Tax=Haloarcula TaxID=2237 RepID=UPI0023E46FB7|nr:hypothetical protein [Halomicroarcula sp. DFY41]
MSPFLTADIEPLVESCEFGEDRVYLLLAIAREKTRDRRRHPRIRRVVEDEGSNGRSQNSATPPVGPTSGSACISDL